MKYEKSDVLRFVEENDVKFVKLAFCDIFGRLKNISILSADLKNAFENGISFDASSIKGFMNVEESDLFLFPDPSTLVVLPWRPSVGRVIRMFCDIKHIDKTDFEGDTRSILKKTVKKAQSMGYDIKIGSEFEFYLFELDENGNPTKKPFDNATYLDVAPTDKGENIRREICLYLEQMDIMPQSSHHEHGPGQNEIDFIHSDALCAADNFFTFKTAVWSVAASNGLFASFMPKPLPNESGNGLHINISLTKNNKNLFSLKSEEADCFLAGILKRISEITLFLNPLTNSYKRFGEHEAPKYITWSHMNRSQLIRIPAAKGEYSRMELRSPDPSINPYLSFALIINAGLEGIENKEKLPPSSDFNAYNADESKLKGIETLPEGLEVAIEYAKKSKFVKSIIPKKIIDTYISEKTKEVLEYKQATDKNAYETVKYFSKI